MKCKLQQPVKDFMYAIGIVFGILGLALYFPVCIGYILINLELGLDLTLNKHIYESPEEVYRALGAVWLMLVLVGGFSLGLIYNILKLLKTLILKPKVFKNWFKENIYNCEGK